MGGQQIHGQGTGDDGYDEDGYDESQRAEILEATRDGPSDGTLMIDLAPDLGLDDPEDEPIDELDMDDDEVGAPDATVAMAEEDMDEDDAQEDFDDGEADDEDEEQLGDANDAALRP